MDTRSPVRFGVIGAGWFASRRHLPDIDRCPDAEIAALCRRDITALEAVRDRLAPQAALYTDWRRMLDEAALGAVLIATPHALHYEQARAALERGLHVLLEKPMTVRAADARDLCDLAASRGLALSVALNPPFWAHCHRMRDAVRDGSIGEIEAISMFWTGNAEYVFGEAPAPADLPGIVPPTMYRGDPDLCGGGYLMDGGPHLISEVLWVTGLAATHVTCIMDRTPSDRRATLAITLSNGAQATICSVGNSKHADRRVTNRFAGSAGTMTVDGPGFETAIERAGQPAERFAERDLPQVSGPAANFVDAVLGRAALFSPAAHGVHVTEVLEAAYRSASEGVTVAL